MHPSIAGLGNIANLARDETAGARCRTRRSISGGSPVRRGFTRRRLVHHGLRVYGGPDDPSFEETREGFTIAAVVAGAFRYACDTARRSCTPEPYCSVTTPPAMPAAMITARAIVHRAQHRACAVRRRNRGDGGRFRTHRFRTAMLPALPVVQSRFAQFEGEHCTR